MNVIFKLKCVGCKMIEERPASAVQNEDGDPPMCNKCYMPMTLESVIYHKGKIPKGPRTLVKRRER